MTHIGLWLVLFAGMQGQGKTPSNPPKGSYMCWRTDEGIFHCKDSNGKELSPGDTWALEPKEPAKPEPMVQPAIKKRQTYQCPPTGVVLYGSTQRPMITCSSEAWTCADPERVLLTTESGRKLCVRFEEGK